MTPSDPAVGTGDGPAVDAPAASCPTPGDCSSGNGSAPRGRGDHGNAVVNHQRSEEWLLIVEGLLFGGPIR